MPLAPVPAIADADRYISYSPVVLTTQFNIPFPLFGDGTDIRVVIDGVTQTSGYTVLSPSGTLANLPRPVTDAYVSLTTGISSGTLEIFGFRRPRRTVQATAAYSTRDFNVVFSDLISNMRELWSQFTRAIQVPIGETSVLFPGQAARAGKVLAFDALGVPTAVDPATGGVITAASISDSTAIGRTLIKAPNAATAQTAIGGTTDGVALFTAVSKAAQRTQLALGTSALLDAGVGNNNVVQLDSSARLPAVNGTQLTGLAPRPNALINPNFDVWQERPSGTTPSLSTLTYFADGWQTFQLGAACLVSRSGYVAGVTTGFLNMQCANIAGAVGNTQVQIMQKIEAVRANQGLRGPVCVSGYLYNATGSTITSVTLALSCPTVLDNWAGFNQRASITLSVNIPNNTFGRVSWTVDTSTFVDGDKGLMVSYILPGVTSGTAQWTGTRIEPAPDVSSGPSSIEQKHPALVLAECQRYYEKSFPQLTAPAQNAGVAGAPYLGQPVAASTAMTLGPFSFKATKRASPTITTLNPLVANAAVRNISVNQDVTGTAIVNASETGFGIDCTSSAGSAAGNKLSVHWTADARL